MPSWIREKLYVDRPCLQVAITLGNIIGSVAGGMILDLCSSKMLLLTGTLVSAAGTLLIVLLVKPVSASHLSVDKDAVHRKNT